MVKNHFLMGICKRCCNLFDECDCKERERRQAMIERERQEWRERKLAAGKNGGDFGDIKTHEI